MDGAPDIEIRQVGQVGRVTLKRPKSLNALTHEMVSAFDTALSQWSDIEHVSFVVVDAASEKAFCVGGDVAQVHRQASAGDLAAPRCFWADEYRLNARIDRYSLPYIAIMNGIVMGGGVGISAHGSHRVVTERSLVAMPECLIGLIPDVGGTWLLANAPGHLGEFLGLTGWRMSGADAILAGFADTLVKSEDLQKLTQRLEHDATLSVLDDLGQQSAPAPLTAHLACIERHFEKETALECLLSLESDPSEFAQQSATMIRRASPISVACAFALIRHARTLSSLEQALGAEYRFCFRAITDGEFLEGIRAQVIDKDKNPHWKPDRLEDVSSDAVQRMLAPLGSAELSFSDGRKL